MLVITVALLHLIVINPRSCAFAYAAYQFDSTALPYEVQRYLDGEHQPSFSDMLQQALSASLESVTEYAVLPLKLFAAVTGWGIAASVCSAALPGKNTLLFKCISLSIGIGFWLSICSMLAPAVLSVNEPVQQAVNMMNLSVPVLSGIVAAGGAPSASMQFQLLCGVLCSVFSSVSVLLIEKVVAFSMGLSAAAAVSNGVFQKVPGAICQFASKALALCSGAFIAYAKLQLSLSATADRSALQLGTTMVFSAVPVLGNTFSSSAGAVAAALSAVKVSLGAACIAAVLTLMLPPLLQLLIIRVALMAGEAVCDIFSGGMLLKDKVRPFLACCDLLAAVHTLSLVLFVFMLYSVVNILG